MTNPSSVCFLGAFAIVLVGACLYVYVNRHRIHEHLVGWLCYELCKDFDERNIPLEPATNWIHKKGLEYAIKHNKKAVFMTIG